MPKAVGFHTTAFTINNKSAALFLNMRRFFIAFY